MEGESRPPARRKRPRTAVLDQTGAAVDVQHAAQLGALEARADTAEREHGTLTGQVSSLVKVVEEGFHAVQTRIEQSDRTNSTQHHELFGHVTELRELISPIAMPLRVTRYLMARWKVALAVSLITWVAFTGGTAAVLRLAEHMLNPLIDAAVGK